MDAVRAYASARIRGIWPEKPSEQWELRLHLGPQKNKYRRLQRDGHTYVHRLSKGSRISHLGILRIHIAGGADISTLSSTKVQQQPSSAFDQQKHPVVKTSNHELFVVVHDQPNMCPAQDWSSQVEIQSFSEAQLTCHASKEAAPWTHHACTSPIHRNEPLEHKRTTLQKQAT